MVVDQKLLKSQMMKNHIWSNVLNKISGQQATTPITSNTQSTAPTNDKYQVVTTKFPTYDIKDLMWFSPTNQRNQISLLQNTAQYNNIQQQAQNNTNPNIRYNIQQPQITNKQTLQIQQATPETNEQWLKINRTASFRDLIWDLKYGAEQWKNLSFMELRQYYPEYVENWSEVLDLYESIKANPNYTTEQITQNAQKAYPELFGIDDNYSSNDKMAALQKLYDEMISNKKNWIMLTQQDIIDRYPEYANTQDINTVMEVQDLINHNKRTPTFNDIAENYEDLIKWNVEVWNTEKEQIQKDLKNINNMFQSTYNGLSDEWKDYVKLLSIAKAVWDAVRQEYWIPEDISDWDILQQLKQSDPEYYNELVWGIENTNLSEQDRKLIDNNGTLKSAWKSIWKSIASQWIDQVIQLWKWLLTKIENWELLSWNKIINTNPFTWEEYENWDPMVNSIQKMVDNNKALSKRDEKINDASSRFFNELQTEIWNVEEEFKNSDLYKDFQSETWKRTKDAIKQWDWWAVASNMWSVIWQTLPALIVWYLTKWKWAGLQKAAEFTTFALPSYQRAMDDIESDKSLSWLTAKEKDNLATRMSLIESAIEVVSLSNMFPWLSNSGWIVSKLPWMKNALLRALVQTEIWATWESLEEVTQEFFNNLLTRKAWSDRSMWEFKDYWDIFTETFLSSQLISAMWWAAEWINQTQVNSIQKQIQQNTELRNKVLEWQAILSDNFNDFANAVDVVPWTTTEELQQVWNNAQQKKQDLEKQSEAITSNSYSNVKLPSYERATVKENQKKLSAEDSQEYTDILDQMEKDGEITKEQREMVERELWVYTKNVEQTEQPQTEWLAKVTEQPKTTKKTWWWTKKMSWLDNETITRIENNPYISNYWNKAVKMVEDEWLSMDNWKIIEQPMQELWEELLQKLDDAEKNLWEDWRMYKLIKDIKQQYDLSESRNWIKNTLDKYDISIIDGKLDFSDSQFVKAEDTNAISRAVWLLNNTNLSNITPKEYWNLRKKLSALAWFDKWTSKDWEAVVRQLRHLVDQLAKEKIPWLKKVDEIFSKEIWYLNEIKQWLVYQQWARKWEIKDNFYSILKTINNQNRQQMNQRLEKIMPDLSDRVEAINMLPKLLKAYAVRSRLVELWARNIWKVWWAVTGWIPWLVVWYVFDEISGKVTKSMRKNAINKIVNNMSDTAKQKLEDIATKQDEKESLTQEERDTLNQVKREIEEMNREREKQWIIRDLEAKENQKALPQNTPIAEIWENWPKIKKPNTPQPTAKKDIIEINNTKPQSPSETEKKSEKKTDKAEQVQAKKKNNQNTKPKTKWLAKINETKEETKTEWLSNMTRQQKVDTKSNFVDFNDVDMSSKHESFGTDASDNSRQKNPNSAAWVTYYTASKMSDLDWLLRRYGGKWVNSTDFVASYTLWELLDNPALYKKYPWLENKLVIFADFHTNKKRWVNFMDTIYINSKIYEKNPWLARSTIVHEIEHEIQKYEWTYVEKSEAYQNSNRLWEDYVNDPNEQWARGKQQEYLDFIGQGNTKFQKWRWNPITKKQVNQLVKQLKKTWLAKDVKVYETQQEFLDEIYWSENQAKFQLADETVYTVQPLERIEEMEQTILDEYGTTENPYRVAFIDNKWRWINGNMWWYGNYRDVDHREIAQTAFDDTDIEFETGTDWLVALQAQTWLVRVNYNDWYLNIDTVYWLMPSQRSWLMDFAKEDINQVYVDITDPKTWRTIESKTFDNVRDAVMYIDNHFSDIQYLKDTHWDIAWAVTPDGTVHLIESNLRWDTATHEFSHLLWSYAKKNNPNLYKALQKIAREAPQELKDYVKRTYGEMTDEAFLDEVFAWKQGKYSWIKTARTWYQRMWDAIKNIWNSIKNSFGSKYADLDVFEAYETMSSEELMDRVDKLLKWGKEIWEWNGNANYEIVKQTDTPEFKKWFEWSKVVDENWEPLVVYHSTNKKRPFYQFKTDKPAWFTPNETYSNSFFAPKYKEWTLWKQREYEVYLNIKNPVYIWNVDWIVNDYKIERLSKYTWIPIEELNEIREYYWALNIFHITNTKEFMNLLKKKWYDGIEAEEWWTKSYWVFEPNQIKSAYDNIWTFDKNNPDIRYEKIWWLSNMQIRKFAVQQWLAEISNP